MTKKDYKLIADAIRSLPEAHAASVVEVLCPALKADNPRFDRERFLAACGISDRPAFKGLGVTS